MSILTDVLTDSVRIDGVIYPIRTDFRVWLEVDKIINSNGIDEADKLIIILRLCFDNEACRGLPPVSEDTMSCLYDFYMWKKPYKNDAKKEKTKNVFSFEYDAEYIYAAFLTQYGIDLLSVPYMHWHVFLALFKGLDDGCRLMKIISLRSVNPLEIKDESKRKCYRKLKEIYELPDSRSELQTEIDFADALFELM